MVAGSVDDESEEEEEPEDEDEEPEEEEDEEPDAEDEDDDLVGVTPGGNGRGRTKMSSPGVSPKGSLGPRARAARVLLFLPGAGKARPWAARRATRATRSREGHMMAAGVCCWWRGWGSRGGSGSLAAGVRFCGRRTRRQTTWEVRGKGGRTGWADSYFIGIPTYLLLL